MPEISIIIPIYNSEACISVISERVKGQTFQDFEAIFIDDGSTDNSLRICNEMAADDNRIRVIHQENSGVSAARNTGLDNASGEYIAFIDSDDLVAQNYLEYLVRGMDEDSVVLSTCGHERIYDYDYHFSSALGESELLLAQQCAKRMLTDNFPVSVWGALFRRDLIGDIRFPVGIRNNEDKQFLYLYLVKNEKGKVAFSGTKLYGYMVRDGSATRSAWNGSVDVVNVADRIREETNKIHPDWDDLAKNACMKARLDVLKSIVRSEPSEHGDQVYKKLKKEIIEFGFPKHGSRRLQVEYMTVCLGKKPYKMLADTYYRVFTEKKRFQRNEKMTQQG